MSFSKHAFSIIFSIDFPLFKPFITICLLKTSPEISFKIWLHSIYFIFLAYFLNNKYISSAVYPIAYSVATILPEEAPEI